MRVYIFTHYREMGEREEGGGDKGAERDALWKYISNKPSIGR